MDEIKNTKNKKEEIINNNKKNNENSKIENINIEEKPVLTELEILQNKYDTLNEKYLRLAAEFENTKRRMAIDTENLIRNRTINTVKEFLPVMDTFDLALKHSNDEGIKSLKKSMINSFLKLGITEIECIGEKLNPNLHNAIKVINDNNKEDNIIVEELQKGYLFADTVLRSSSVVVNKKNN